jgi:hypothetical protein
VDVRVAAQLERGKDFAHDLARMAAQLERGKDFAPGAAKLESGKDFAPAEKLKCGKDFAPRFAPGLEDGYMALMIDLTRGQKRLYERKVTLMV